MPLWRLVLVGHRILGVAGLSDRARSEELELEVEDAGIDLLRFKAMTVGVHFVDTLELMQIMSIKSTKQYGRGPIPSQFAHPTSMTRLRTR